MIIADPVVLTCLAGLALIVLAAAVSLTVDHEDETW
jgi:hypothetical protein